MSFGDDTLVGYWPIGPNLYKGVHMGKRVGIEKLKGCDKGNSYEFELHKDLLELMTCGHRNILQFCGICVDDNNGLCVVTKFMKGGSVHDHSYINVERKKPLLLPRFNSKPRHKTLLYCLGKSIHIFVSVFQNPGIKCAVQEPNGICRRGGNCRGDLAGIRLDLQRQQQSIRVQEKKRGHRGFLLENNPPAASRTKGAAGATFGTAPREEKETDRIRKVGCLTLHVFVLERITGALLHTTVIKYFPAML
ncbi:hypothetical protein V8G54_007581 [Vigna mungo]|uniref:Uncharacterized protein n=1 Tax=Vigna mungo TaxID=3915 RepID=A0AAQ3S5L0_VIGMU